MIDELQIKRIQKNVKAGKSKPENYRQNLEIEAAMLLKNYIIEGVKEGLPMEVSFELAVDHLKCFSEAILHCCENAKLVGYNNEAP